MGEILGVGCTHRPVMLRRNEDWTFMMKASLDDPAMPDEMKNPARWPAPLREELGGDWGTSAAARAREVYRCHFAEARQALDDFKPDLIVMWGDDQYENFRDLGLRLAGRLCLLQRLNFQEARRLGSAGTTMKRTRDSRSRCRGGAFRRGRRRDGVVSPEVVSCRTAPIEPLEARHRGIGGREGGAARRGCDRQALRRGRTLWPLLPGAPRGEPPTGARRRDGTERRGRGVQSARPALVGARSPCPG